MAAIIDGNRIAPHHLRMMLLDYGMDNEYQVVTLDEIARTLSHVDKELLREGLDHLAEEGLVTRFSGRYCFNKPIPMEDRQTINQNITPSGTIRIREDAC